MAWAVLHGCGTPSKAVQSRTSIMPEEICQLGRDQQRLCEMDQGPHYSCEACLSQGCGLQELQASYSRNAPALHGPQRDSFLESSPSRFVGLARGLLSSAPTLG